VTTSGFVTPADQNIDRPQLKIIAEICIQRRLLMVTMAWWWSRSGKKRTLIISAGNPG
jgi:hypothetical protein